MQVEHGGQRRPPLASAGVRASASRQAQLAEAARVAAEAKQAEDLRKADELRRQNEAQRAQDAVGKAEADRLGALKAADEARREANAARAEQQRLAKVAAEAEAGRQSGAIVAALPSRAQAPPAGRPSGEPLADQANLKEGREDEKKRKILVHQFHQTIMAFIRGTTVAHGPDLGKSFQYYFKANPKAVAVSID